MQIRNNTFVLKKEEAIATVIAFLNYMKLLQNFGRKLTLR